MKVGETGTLKATVLPANADNTAVEWTTNNSAAAIVSNGTVTAVTKGTATITATLKDGSGRSASATVTVKEYGSIKLAAKNTSGSVIPGVNIGVYTDSSATALYKSGWTATDGTLLFTGLDAKTYYIKMINVPSGYKLPAAILTVTAEDDKTTEANIVLDKAAVQAYKNWQLKNIAVSKGTLSPVFDSDTLKYSLKLDEKTSSVKITPTKADSASKLYINSKSVKSITVSLKSGETKKITIRVQPVSGKNVYYYVTVTRAKSSNADIKSLKSTRGTLQPKFSKDTTAYTLSLSRWQYYVRMNFVLDSAFSDYSLSLNGRTVHSKTLSIKRGETKTLKITVKAQNGTKKVYTIVIKRAK